MGYTISGYAALFYDGTPATEYEFANGMFERIGPTAFDTALSDNFGFDVVAAVNHDPNLPIGRRGDDAASLILSKDSRGLKYEVHAPDTQIARDAVQNIRAKILKGSSFAFAVNDEAWQKDGSRDIRTVLDVLLFDVAPVTYPAYRSTELPAFALSAKERSIADESRAGKLREYSRRATEVAREQHRGRTMVMQTGPLNGRLIEHANRRRDNSREAILEQSKRLLVTRFNKLTAEQRTADPMRRAAIASELKTLAQRKAGLDSVLGASAK